MAILLADAWSPKPEAVRTQRDLAGNLGPRSSALRQRTTGVMMCLATLGGKGGLAPARARPGG